MKALPLLAAFTGDGAVTIGAAACKGALAGTTAATGAGGAADSFLATAGGVTGNSGERYARGTCSESEGVFASVAAATMVFVSGLVSTGHRSGTWLVICSDVRDEPKAGKPRISPGRTTDCALSKLDATTR